MYQATIFPTGRIDCDEAVLFQGGDSRRFRPINCYAYLLEGKGEKILIDTGIQSVDAVNRTKRGVGVWRRGEGDRDLSAHLAARGISPGDIAHVVLTHAHYDHIGALVALEGAQIHLQEAEWEELFAGENPVLAEVRAFLLRQRQLGRVCLARGDGTAADGIALHAAAGHTAGSQMVEADTQFGPTLFTGDAVFLLDNVQENRPIGFCARPEGAAKALEFCRGFRGACMTGHDPACQARFGGEAHV